jgi:hypothetical protein
MCPNSRWQAILPFTPNAAQTSEQHSLIALGIPVLTPSSVALEIAFHWFVGAAIHT